MVEVKCNWVPGTVDTLRLRAGNRHCHLTVGELRRLFGLPALNAMYLNGSYRAQVDASTLTSLALL
ncbi:hypothetical protein [Deinococcus hohokamensis]|uniref:Uncharacterized protein n=1 Tax=Deinococcus hohokamensis TaxID=309883 RepID=A0ABV9ID34_9DEIO